MCLTRPPRQVLDLGGVTGVKKYNLNANTWWAIGCATHECPKHNFQPPNRQQLPVNYKWHVGWLSVLPSPGLNHSSIFRILPWTRGHEIRTMLESLPVPHPLAYQQLGLRRPASGSSRCCQKEGLKIPTNSKQWSGKKVMILNEGTMFEVRALQGAKHQEMARVLWQSHHWLINKQLCVPEGDKTKPLFTYRWETEQFYTLSLVEKSPCFSIFLKLLFIFLEKE